MLISFQKVPLKSTLVRLQACCVCLCAYDLVSKARFLFNKLTSVLSCICPVINDKFRHNIVKAAVDPRTALTML